MSLFVYLGSGLVFFDRKNATFELTFTNTNSKGYCDETFFKFSFWSFSSVYISLGLLIVVGLVALSINDFAKKAKVKVF